MGIITTYPSGAITTPWRGPIQPFEASSHLSLGVSRGSAFHCIDQNPAQRDWTRDL